MPLYEQSSVETSGNTVEEDKIHAPWRIDYVPNPVIGYSQDATQDFRIKIGQTPVGSVLYTLVAYFKKEGAVVKGGVGQL